MAAGACWAGRVDEFVGRGLGEVDEAPLRERGDLGTAGYRDEKVVASGHGRIICRPVNLHGLVDGLLFCRRSVTSSPSRQWFC